MNWRRTLGRWVPEKWRTNFWRMLEVPARRNFQRRLSHLSHVPRRGAPALHYGDVLGGDEVIHGGRVKLLHLIEEFPSVPDFNLLYLVSSAPPRFAPELVAWARAQGVKLIWNQNGVAYPAWYGARSEELNAPMRTLHAQADFVFYQSEFCRDCADRFLGPASAAGEIAYNCVDTAHFRPGPPDGDSPCRLLVAGSHHDSYRVISALETVAELLRRRVAVELHLVGRLQWTGAAEEIAAKIRALGIAGQVRRTAAYTQQEAPAIYQAAHILLHLKYKDPCPTVPIEAMACGVPVIGSASGGMPELVSSGAGVLLEVPDSWENSYWPEPAAIADAVETIMSRWPKYRAAARANAETRFSSEQWVAKHRRVFHALAGA